MGEDKIKNHVQIPKFLLESFCDKNNGYKVCRMNCNQIIDFELPKNCNILANYYSSFIESDILASLESNFGQVKKKILLAIKCGNKLALTENDVDIIQWFFLFCLARQPHIADSFHSEEETIWFFDGKTNRDAFIEFADLAKRQLFNDLYPDYRICISVNRTIQNFVIPQNCTYNVYQSDEENYPMCVLPISPKIIINLIKIDINKEIKRTVCPIIYIDDLVKIDAFNETAIFSELKSEKDDKFKFIYAHKMQDFARYDIRKIIG